METDETQGAWSSLVLLERLRAGDEQAAEAVFSRYFNRLTLLARSRLSSRLARRADPEDVVMSVYRSFFVKARQGRFALSRGGDLWRLLATITKHKLLHQTRRELAERRSIDVELPIHQVDEARFQKRENEPTPEDAIAMADELEAIFSNLDTLATRVLELRLQGSQLSEISNDTGRSERTVRRTLVQIRELMSKRLENA